MRIGVLTSGGDAPGMNAAIRAVVRRALSLGWRATGIRGGYAGLFTEELVDLDSRSVANILQRGGTILGAGRCDRFHDADARAEAAGMLRRRAIDALVVIGGDGSYRGMQALHAEHGVRVVGLPGTIDNDVGGTDTSIGFDTAVNTALDSIDRIRDTAFSHDRLFFVEVMGRDSGAIASAVGLAGGAEAVLVPETSTDLDQLADRIDRSVARGKLASIIIVAEGDKAGGAREIAEAVTERLRHRLDCRVAVLGHIQRGGSPSAADRVLASRMGAFAVEALHEGRDPCVVGVSAGDLVTTEVAAALEARPALDRGQLRLTDQLAGTVPWDEQ